LLNAHSTYPPERSLAHVVLISDKWVQNDPGAMDIACEEWKAISQLASNIAPGRTGCLTTTLEQVSSSSTRSREQPPGCNRQVFKSGYSCRSAVSGLTRIARCAGR
jgi:hypothetical protein